MARGRRRSDHLLHPDRHADDGGFRFFPAGSGGQYHEEPGRGRRNDVTLVSDDLDELYEQALDCGIRPVLFWELSPLEVADLMASYHRKERRKFRQQVGLSFLQAELTARYVSLQKGDPLPEPWEYYPTLFEEEKQAFEQEKLKEYYEKRREDAARYNQRRHQTEES